MTASGLGVPSGGGERTLPKSSLAVLAVCTDTVPGIGSGSVHTPCESPCGASIWKGCVLGWWREELPVGLSPKKKEREENADSTEKASVGVLGEKGNGGRCSQKVWFS